MLTILISCGKAHVELEIEQLAINNSIAAKYYSIPKALLLPIPIISTTFNLLLNKNHEIYLIVDAINFKSYERWAMNIGFPLQRIKNIGSTFSTFEKSLPSVLEYIIRYIPIFSHDSIQIMDCCFQYSDINEGGSFYGNDAITSDFYHFYVNLDPDLLPIFCEYVKSSNNTDGLLSYLIKMKPSMKNITPINDNRLFLKKSNWAEFKTVLDPVSNNIATRIISKVYARVGLMGNPSDGFYGKTISLLINNFWAETTLVESTDESIQFILNPLLDPIKFDSIRNINSIMKKDGYSGASTLFLALIKVFVDYCNSNNIEIKSRGFKILYNTNIPRQVGLAGSSALVISLLKSLIQFYNLSDRISLHDQTIIALAAEKQELLISSGPQDRVIQTYGGLMFMDFQKDLMINRGYGNYSSLNLHNECLKGLWIAYVAQPKNSGKVHNLVRQRFENGDLEVLNGMKTLSDLSDQAAIALNRNNRSELAKLMDLNFEARKRLYGLEVLGEASLRMIEIAHQHDFAAKFSGSGGCIVGLWRGKVGSIEEKEAMSILKVDLENEGFVFAYVLRGNDDTEA